MVGVGLTGTGESSHHFQLMVSILNFITYNGMSTQASLVVKAAFEEVGLQEVYCEVRNSHWIGDMNEDLVEWGTESLRDITAPALLVAGKAKNMEEAVAMKQTLIAKVYKEWEQNPPNMAHALVVGRKPI
jgi:hypothetical protein